MLTKLRLIPALGAVLFALIGLSACGSSGVPSNAVMAVDGTPITSAAFNHWLGVAAYCLAIAVVFVAFTYAVTWLGNVLGVRSGRNPGARAGHRAS